MGEGRERVRSRRFRRIATAVLVVVTSLVFTVAVAGVWARRYVVDTGRWVGTVGPVIEHPVVRAALASWMTNELMEVVDPEELFERALPERGQVLAAPMTVAVRGFVNSAVQAVLASDAVEQLWVRANELAHDRVVDALEGDTDNLQIEDGKVVLNLVSMLNRVLAEIGEASPEIFGRTVNLPTITVDETPEEAIAKLEDALGRDIPDDFGQFTVFEASRLRQAQDAVQLFNQLAVVTMVAAAVLIGLTHWLAPRRRRTLLQLMVGMALGLAAVRRIGIRLGEDVVGFVQPENQPAVKVAVDAFVSNLEGTIAWLLGILALVAAVAVLSGPYPWAKALRRRTASFARALGVAIVGAVWRGPDDPTAAWVGRHKVALQLGGIVAVIVMLLVVDLSWLGLVLLALIGGAFELVVWRIGHRKAPVGEPVEAAPVSSGGG